MKSVHHALIGTALALGAAACLHLASCSSEEGGDPSADAAVAPDVAVDGHVVDAAAADSAADAGGPADAAVDACGVCASGACTDGGCDPAVFLTSKEYAGAIGDGGVVAADQECATLAAAAGLSGKYRAWLAMADGSAPASRFENKSTRPYRLVDGTRVAADFASLGKTLEAPIGLTEQRTAIAFAYVWTAAERNGTSIADGGDCAGWTSSDAAVNGGAGESDDVVEEWTKYADIACSTMARLYCFEQRP